MKTNKTQVEQLNELNRFTDDNVILWKTRAYILAQELDKIDNVIYRANNELKQMNERAHCQNGRCS